MKGIAAVLVLILASAVSLLAHADCVSQCVFTCSQGPAEDYQTCLDECLEGCNPDPVPAPSPPVPVEPSTPTAPTPPTPSTPTAPTPPAAPSTTP